MEQEINTLELAKLYEKQGYINEAQKMYDVLNNRNPTSEAAAGLKRMTDQLANRNQRDEDHKTRALNSDSDDILPEQKLSADLEKWMRLVLMENRLITAKQLKQNCRPDQP